LHPQPTAPKQPLLVVDDQKMNAEAISSLLSPFFDVTPITEQEDFWGCYQKTQPSLVVMDLMLNPYMEPKESKLSLDGLELIKQAYAEGTHTKFFVLTQFAHVQTAIACFKAGARGFLPKVNASSEEIVGAILSVNDGNIFYPEEYDSLDSNRLIAYTSDDLRDLTQDEVDIISFVISGYDYPKIADDLAFKTDQSLRNKISRMLKKTPFSSMSRLSTYCATIGMSKI